MYSELSEYYVSLEKSFLHITFRTGAFQTKYQKCQIYTTLERTPYSPCSHVTREK